MVRYARAKGSKSSNERLPNEATPWHVMKEQLEETQKKKEFVDFKKKTAKQLLQEKEEPFYSTSLNVSTDWAEFESSSVKKEKSSLNHVKDGKIKKKKETKEQNIQAKNTVGETKIKIVKDEIISPKTKSYLTKISKKDIPDKKNLALESKPNTDPNFKRIKVKEEISENKNAESAFMQKKIKEEISENENAESDFMQKKIKEETSEKKTPESEESVENEFDPKAEKRNAQKLKRRLKRAMKAAQKAQELPESDSKPEETNSADKPATKELSSSAKRRQRRRQKMEKGEDSKETKPNLKRKNEDPESGEAASQSPEKPAQILSKRQKRNLKKKKPNDNEEVSDKKTGSENNEFDRNGLNKKFPRRSMDDDFRRKNGRLVKHHHMTPGKVRDDQEHARRKPDEGSMKMEINGMEVEVVKYDGYPVRKEDAERLTELRKQMVIKGIPKTEIDNAMKLERRKAEKALARIRKVVCFLCRKAGHNLSDCPNLDTEQSATGVCFKCGSTEHTHFECKVNRTDEFRFASCFICRQRGHIAKQCPDNPKGLYPDGGCCKVCGDVTHLKKDCPDLMKKKEESTLTVSTISGECLEDLDEDLSEKKPTPIAVKQKVVKF